MLVVLTCAYLCKSPCITRASVPIVADDPRVCRERCYVRSARILLENMYVIDTAVAALLLRSDE